MISIKTDGWTSAVGKGDELIYSELNPFFKNSPLEEVINRYTLKRSRLIMMRLKSCYSMHLDDTHRII